LAGPAKSDRTAPTPRAANSAAPPAARLATKEAPPRQARKPRTAKNTAQRVAKKLARLFVSVSCLGALAVLLTGSQERVAVSRSEAAVPHARQAMAAAPATTPESTTATYADWTVQCGRRIGSPSQMVCAMMQTTQVRGKGKVFSRVVIIHSAKGEPYRLTVELPVDASFTQAVRIETNDADTLLSAPFERCVPIGCFANIDLGTGALQKLRAAAGAGKLLFADAVGRDIAVPLSFKGFSKALDAIMEQ
jgi:invasion protein IalB